MAEAKPLTVDDTSDGLVAAAEAVQVAVPIAPTLPAPPLTALAPAKIMQVARPGDPCPDPIGDADSTEIADIVRSGLLDVPFYLARYGDLSRADIDPIGHFTRFGDAERRWPNAWFNPSFYVRQVSDFVASGLGPLMHYIRHGQRAGLRPHPHFDAGWYRRAYAVPDGMSPLRHFLDHRLVWPHAPSAELHALTRTAQYARDLAVRIDPFLAELDRAAETGADPSPDVRLVDGSGLLDINYYLINGSDVMAADLDPSRHFCSYGWREGRKPNIYFDTAWYIATNPEVARREVNPLVHYVQIGEAAGRRPIVYFDPAWYRRAYGLPETESPLRHFLTHRRSQKYSPNEDFDVDWYLATYGEKVGPNRDPFAHFLQTGTYQNVDPSATFSSADYRRKHLGRPSKHFRNRMHPDQDNPLVHALHARYL